MAAEPYVQEDSRVLTPEAFDFVFANELKRAVRSQNFLTLLVMEPGVAGAPHHGNGEREGLVRQIASLVSRDVRETDLLAQTKKGRLSIVLFDTDLQNSMRVVDRLMARLEHYAFHTPIEIEVGAACCPTHGADPESLERAAEARPLRPRQNDTARNR